jgi:hypothetical protein
MRSMRWIAVLAASAVIVAALAIEPPQPAPGAPAKPDSTETEPVPQEPSRPESTPGSEAKPGEAPAPAAEDEAEEEELPPLPPDTEPVGPSPQRFNPTEKVRADFPVSFPIDI